MLTKAACNPKGRVRYEMPDSFLLPKTVQKLIELGLIEKCGHHWDMLHGGILDDYQITQAGKRAALAAMTLDEFRKLHPTAAPEVLEALYDDRLVAFDEDVAVDELVADMDEQCPLCGGPQQILGKLGQRVHLRCRNCGADTNSAS
jgi:hypothetical protein